MLLAVRNDKYITYATLSDIFDTLRLLADSMDFLDEDGNGWEVIEGLCHNANVSNYGDLKSKMALLTWMLRPWSYDLKTYFVRRRFGRLLFWTLFGDQGQEPSNLLLNLGDAETIDQPLFTKDGYNLLHNIVSGFAQGDVSAVLTKHPDLHRLGFDYNSTPQEESPTSLAMYSSWKFTEWQIGLFDN